MRTPQRLREGSRRGSAMVETVFALPAILIMLVAIIGFAVATKRLSPLENAARYDSWRGTTPGAPGPATDTALSAAVYPKDAPAEFTRGTYDTTLSSRVDTPLTSAVSGDAQSLANRLVGHFPRGLAVNVTSRHTSGIPLFTQFGFTSSVTRGAGTLNGEWRFAGGIEYLGQAWAAYPDGWHPKVVSGRDDPDARLAQDVKELFLQSLDSQLPSDGGTLSEAIQAVYVWYPGYCGPNWILNPGAFPQGQ